MIGKVAQEAYFSLTPTIYAAHFDTSVIILDSAADKYLSLIDTSAQSLLFILENPLLYDGTTYKTVNNSYDSEQLNELNEWIAYFLENKFIVASSENNRKKIAGEPLQEGGLIHYQWDRKSDWQPFIQAPKWLTLKAFFQLAHVHRIMKRTAMRGLLDEIKKTQTHNKNNKKFRTPTLQEINNLVVAIDAASLLYPKKTFCLAWAVTYVLLSRKNGLEAQLVMGIQTNPFYAHAWAESAGHVVHDDPAIAHVLSIILREPIL